MKRTLDIRAIHEQDPRSFLRNLPAIVRVLILALLAVIGGATIGFASQRLGAPQALVLTVLPVVVVAFLRSAWVSLFALVFVVFVIPYAVIPFSTPGGTPALVEIAAFGSLAVIFAVVLCDRRMMLPSGPLVVAWLSLAGVTVFAFLLGYGRGYTPQTMHDFVKFALAVSTFLIVLVLVRRLQDAVLLLRMLLAGTIVAAGIAVLLFAGGPSVTERALARLVPYGYPSGNIVRYIEGDPAKPMRAVGTGVDPNSFGGLMLAGVVLSAGQFLARKPVVNRWLAGSALGLAGLAMMLTYSRGAWVGAAAGVGLILVFRRRALLPVFGLAGFAAVAAGLGSGMVDRLWQGFTLQDPATRLRLQEYQNALEIIRRHPWFGVGFGDAGAIDLQEGVSSAYLTVAEIAGLVGLAFYLLVVGWILLVGIRRLLLRAPSETTDVLLTVTATFAGFLTTALVDHYFFNIQFPHMAALFWIVAGLIVAVARIEDADRHLLEARGET